MLAAYEATKHSDVIAHFASRQGSFGAMNLLPNHLPDEDRIRTLVVNALTIDYAIGVAYDVPQYVSAVKGFAAASVLNFAKLGLDADTRQLYSEQLASLEGKSRSELAGAVSAAVGNSLSAINLFSPRQCNLQCRSCYTSATSIDKTPFTEQDVDTYFRGFVRVARQAKAMGAKTIYTSGDGELSIFPRFFDLLEFVQNEGLQWLFFTAGLSFSNEANAERTWATSRSYVSELIRDRVDSFIDRARKDGERKPVVSAFLQELARYRDSIQVYHSVWSTDAATNTVWRRPTLEDYEYVEVDARGDRFHLPSSVLDLMTDVFVDEHRSRFGIEMPVSEISAGDVLPLATFVVDHGIRSYFEQTVVTGRNQTMSLAAAAPEVLARLHPFMARTNCSFRNIHQPTVKVRPGDAGLAFYTSPGMGIGFRDLDRAGALPSCDLSEGDELFAALHAPLMAHANYGYVLACKCDLFVQEARHDGGKLYDEWRRISSLLPTASLSLDGIVTRLRESRAGH